MNEKRIPLETEESRYKKRAKRRRASRADHKHTYETVVLYRYYEDPFHSGEVHHLETATKVCSICGRIGNVDQSQYELIDIEESLPYPMKKRVIRDADKLEIWHTNSYFDKFATRGK